MRITAAIAALSLLAASACTMSRGDKATVTAVGAMATTAGVVMLGVGPNEVDSDGDGRNEDPFNDNYTVPVIGLLLATVGSVMLLGGLTASVAPESPAELRAEPVEVAAPAQERALPEVAVDEETLRLAQQARLVVAAGHCEPARALLGRIAERSASYYNALVQSSVLDRCPQLRYISID